jgi:Flp pilus assembly protein TadB
MSDEDAPGRSGSAVVISLAALATLVGGFVAVLAVLLAYLVGTPVWAICVAVGVVLVILAIAVSRVRRSARRL